MGEEPLTILPIREDLGLENTPTRSVGEREESPSIRGALKAAADDSSRCSRRPSALPATLGNRDPLTGTLTLT